MLMNGFFLFPVFEGYGEADVRVLGPQSTITPYWSTGQENISQNGGIAGHQNLSHFRMEMNGTRPVRDRIKPRPVEHGLREIKLRCRLCSFHA